MTFKASVIGAIASVVAVGAATAADLPSYKAPPPPPAIGAWDWTGWHLGVSGSYGGGSAAYASSIWTVGFPGGWNNVTSSSGTSGFLVGVQSGYTWQLSNNFIIGYESEFNYADVRSGNAGAWGGPMNSRLNWFGAERIRLGYAFGRILPYVTGGLAYGQVRANGNDTLGGFVFPTAVSTWQAGWTVGAGVEYGLWTNVSIKAEYLYSRLNGPRGSGLGFPGVYRAFEGRGFDTHIARIGINYQIKNFGADRKSVV